MFARSFSALVLCKSSIGTPRPPFLSLRTFATSSTRRWPTSLTNAICARHPGQGMDPHRAHAGDLLAALARIPTWSNASSNYSSVASRQMRARVAHVYLRFEDERLSPGSGPWMRRGVVSDEPGRTGSISSVSGRGALVMELLEGSEAEVSALAQHPRLPSDRVFRFGLDGSRSPARPGLLPRLEDALAIDGSGFYDVAGPGLV